MNGKELVKLKIDPSAVMPVSSGLTSGDVELLESLIVGAVNDAGHKADEAIQSRREGRARWAG